MQTVRKIIKANVKVLDEAKGTIEAVVSTESIDRDGDIIRQAHWDLSNFNRHPVLLDSHNYIGVENILGRWTSMSVKGGELVGVAQYKVGEGNQKADWAFSLAKDGLAAFSVGFIPDMGKASPVGKGFEFKGQELLEVSQVTIPSNPDALQRMKGQKNDAVIQDIVNQAIKQKERNIVTKQKPTKTDEAADTAATAVIESISRSE